ncbi:hypothetical protein SAY87_026557 [Trapa incisa]|uniref:Uncharacterized protein n=1 Tax=Trapa incisa TaxID=236973 RepID=A0AAN7JMC8_9MYRT|nr:hypothetical protein SAY87_026557 [Trapa incisa]
MAQNHCSGPRPLQEDDSHQHFNLHEWDLKANWVGRHTVSSRRFSASNIVGMREEACRSFRSSVTAISSSPSSPGYPLKALQVKSSIRTRDCLSPEGFALNSKWSDAEKYICNPYSGQVPVECLSARSFRNLQSRITMSAPLVYSDKTRIAQIRPALTAARKSLFQTPIEEKDIESMKMDVGIHSIEAEINKDNPSSSSSSNLTPASTPSIKERMSKRLGAACGESSNSSSKLKSAEEVEVIKKEEDSVEESGQEASPFDFGDDLHEGGDEEEEQTQESTSRQPAGVGCLSWMRSRRVNLHQREEAPMSERRNIKKRNFFIISCTKARRRKAGNEDHQ